MSTDHPETLEEWKSFKFPVKERSSLSEALRNQAIANGEQVDDTDTNQGEEGEEGEGDQGQGTPVLIPVEAVVETDGVTRAETPVAEMGAIPQEPVPSAIVPPAEPEVDAEEALVGPPAASKLDEGTPVAPVSTDPVPLAPAVLVLSKSAHPVAPASETGDSWSYDAARGILINWRIERVLILNKMDRVSKITEFARQVEKNQIDRKGFEAALDLACQDIHGMPLSTLLTAWNAAEPLQWGQGADQDHLPGPRTRRRPLSR